MIKKFNIDGVGFVQPTVKREVQFMNELKKKLNLPVKEITITKIKTDIIIPQKTLNKLNDRIENAQKTFALEESGHFNNILLVDDAVGSGATLNEIAKKIKDKRIAKKVIGLAITGSFKGFDVISEV
jgi:predicted amidophosphoribosyltransferase